MLKDERVIVALAWGFEMAKLREVDLKTNPEIAEAFKRLEASARLDFQSHALDRPCP